MESEIWEQVTVLAQNSERYLSEAKKILQNRSFDLVVLIARGSSDNAALFARYLIETFWKIPVSLSAPSIITKYKSEIRYPRSLAIGISQSGAAPDVSEVLDFMRGQGHETLALSNSPGSRVSSVAKNSISLNVGAEYALAATKTYTSSLLALYQIVRALASELPEPVLPTSECLERAQIDAQAASQSVLRANRWFALSRGFEFATAHETALKLMECSLTPVKAYSLADFEHGPKALATHGSMALVFGQSPEWLAGQGCDVIERRVSNPQPFNPITSIVFSQFLALAVARAKGLNPDQVSHLSKVTETL